MGSDSLEGSWRPRVDDRLVNEVLMSALTLPTLLVAHELKLFPLLAERPRTLEELRQELNIERRPLRAVLRLCASRGLVSIQDGRYALTPEAEEYLLESSPASYSDYLNLLKATSPLLTFESVKAAVLSNAPQAYGGGTDIFKTHEEQAEQARSFTRMMHGHSVGPASAWPDHLDLSGHHHMLDIGGGSGAHSIGAARRWPHLRATVLDLPTVCDVAREYLTQAGLRERVGTLAADMWQDSLPKADLHFYSEIFHDWPPEKCLLLARRSFESLEPGGRIVVHEMLYDEEKQLPYPAAAYTVGMLLWTEGQQFTGPELSALLTQAGFVDIELKPTFGYWSIATGRKP
ncbi:methyltransferase [Hyalangium sp.]|uniref:methyltransferase n=1 Tax=Hyalangium sp. TaxID=2028555 RepID=UPI002D3365A2|nr:methyltransferase [Hyalangium sp.]HYH98018.1 methyltransferase [Hyalangium sp.]